MTLLSLMRPLLDVPMALVISCGWRTAVHFIGLCSLYGDQSLNRATDMWRRAGMTLPVTLSPRHIDAIITGLRQSTWLFFFVILSDIVAIQSHDFGIFHILTSCGLNLNASVYVEVHCVYFARLWFSKPELVLLRYITTIPDAVYLGLSYNSEFEDTPQRNSISTKQSNNVRPNKES